MINIGVTITATTECGDIAEIASEAENLGYELFWFIFVSSAFLPGKSEWLHQESNFTGYGLNNAQPHSA